MAARHGYLAGTMTSQSSPGSLPSAHLDGATPRVASGNHPPRHPRGIAAPHVGVVGAFLAAAGAMAAVHAVHADGGVRAWGQNFQGQCNVPNELGPCSAVAAGVDHTVALRKDGGVRAWGINC